MNDFLTINRIKKGDIKAFEKVFKLYYSPLCLYAASLTGEMDTAEEIVQDLFYTFWKEREKIELYYSLKSYLYAAVRNRSFIHLEHQEVRNRYRETVLSEADKGTDSPEQQMEYKELQQIVDQTIQRLPERRRQIFRMHRFEGMKYAEIASSLSLSVKTVESEMSKALQVLKSEVMSYRL